MEEIVAMVAILGFFISVSTILQTYLKNRHVERLALIKFGQNASVFGQGKGSYKPLKWGLGFVSLGMGLLVGYIFDTIFGADGPLFVFGFTFLFGGLSMIFYYRYVASKLEDTTMVEEKPSPKTQLDEMDDFML